MAGAGGRRFFFSELSLGTRRILGMLAALLFDKRTVMLIEEPEDSVHPGLLEKFLGIWRAYSKTTMLVFSTHSPHVLDLLKPSELLLVSAPNGETVVRALDEKEKASAERFLKGQGAMSDFISTLDE
jgi:predicted ATPase